MAVNAPPASALFNNLFTTQIVRIFFPALVTVINIHNFHTDITLLHLKFLYRYIREC
ncbi:hypothetical protein SeW_A3552 [Salmonella enterica subsp. enterica serovar Weltevreden str. HI_N05-537]|nr:hypothetical protein SeW_A3552 [Salmonella enterica subsp. enterica serovar Weltevreden str. HI_N05-537]